jgi:hypothetical protein
MLAPHTQLVNYTPSWLSCDGPFASNRNDLGVNKNHNIWFSVLWLVIYHPHIKIIIKGGCIISTITLKNEKNLHESLLSSTHLYICIKIVVCFVLFCGHTLTLSNHKAPHYAFGIIGKSLTTWCACGSFYKISNQWSKNWFNLIILFISEKKL